MAGGIGGHFVESPSPGGSAAMLAVGMGLVIPTLVVVLNATSYKPPNDDKTEPVNNQPAAEPPAAKPPGARRATPPLHARKVPRLPPPSFLGVQDGRLAFGMPAVELRPTYSQLEMAQYGVTQHEIVHVPVFQASF